MTCSRSDRLRWIADYLELAGKALSVIACVQGIDYPEDLDSDLQSELRALAEELEISSGPDAGAGVLRFDADPLFQVMVGLRSSAAAVSRLCEGSHPPMELLEVNSQIQSALVRTTEYATESLMDTRGWSMSSEKRNPFPSFRPAATRPALDRSICSTTCGDCRYDGFQLTL